MYSISWKEFKEIIDERMQEEKIDENKKIAFIEFDGSELPEVCVDENGRLEIG
jgi:hypothetical protein